MREKRLIKDIFIYGLGTFGASFVSFLLLPFYTKVFSRAEYGFIDLVVTGSILLASVISLRLTDGAYRFVIEETRLQARTATISSVVNVILINVFIFVILCWLGAPYLRGIIPYSSLFLVVFYIALKVIDACFLQIVRALGKNVLYSKSGIILTSSMFVFNIIFIGYFGQGVSGFFIAAILAHAISLLYKVKKADLIKFYNPMDFNMAVITPILKYSLPLLPATISWWFIRISGRYILSIYKGLDEVGIYAVADKIPSVMYIGSLIFYMAWQDSALDSASHPDKETFFSKIFNKLVLTGGSIVIVCLVFLKPFFHIMVDPRYLSAHIYLPYLLLAILILTFAWFYEIIFQIHKNTMVIFYSALIAAAINVILNILLVPTYGIAATTFSVLVASISALFLRVILSKDKVKIAVDKIMFLKLGIVFIVSILIFQLGLWLYIFSASLILAYISYINRGSISLIVGILRGEKGSSLGKA
ncbi:MAG: hypothetical protein NC938_04980 [Candidatus Omnitrophica bacterium]|nr:hypothetical protein [Candidatus Omnitrophota bacterium]